MGLRIPVFSRRWLFFPPVLIGMAIFVGFILHRQPPQRNLPTENVRTLRVIEAPLVDVVPRIVGHGTANAAQVWRAVAEVEGRVVEVRPELNPGAFMKANEVVLKIDRREYELAVSRLASEEAQIEAQLAELTTQEENDRALLEIEQTSLDLARADWDRVRNLVDREAAVQTEVRDEERAFLAQKQKVQSLQNSLNLLPKKRSTLQASLAVRRARLEEAQLDLEKTTIHAPFDCRLGDVQIETGQFLKTGEILFEADGVATTEVDVHLPIDRARKLLAANAPEELGGIPDMAELRERFEIEATVTMRIGDFSTEWPGRFVRVREQIDPTTRTVAVVVAVDKPYERAIPGQRPPLVKGTFCEVELRGKRIAQRVIIPRTALHDGHVYILDADNRLRQRLVSVMFAQSDFLCLAEGLSAGERVIVSDPTPAIDGMLVDPVRDEALEATLIAEAQGRASIR